jgi:hypothetical protein
VICRADAAIRPDGLPFVPRSVASRLVGVMFVVRIAYVGWMADALEPEDAEDRKLRERLAGRVGRQVQGVAAVRPATRDGWISWAGMGVDDSLAPILTAAVAFTATLSAQERRRARATGLATRMALAVTEHEAHLFRTRAIGRIIGDHAMTVPYGLVTRLRSARRSPRGSWPRS